MEKHDGAMSICEKKQMLIIVFSSNRNINGNLKKYNLVLDDLYLVLECVISFFIDKKVILKLGSPLQYD